MNKRLIFLLTLVCLIATGCSMVPEFIKPKPPIPAHWPQGEAYQGDVVNGKLGTSLSRQEFFVDQKLLQVIDLALENNRDLRLAVLNVHRSQALYGVRRAELFPAVNVTAAGGKTRQSKDLIYPGDPRTKEQYSINLGVVSWEIDFFGRIRSLKDQALETYLASDEARHGAEISLVSEVANVYLTLAADRQNLQLAKAALATRKAAYGLVKKRYDAGVSTELDLRQAQIPVEAGKGDVARYEQQVALDRNYLNLLAGGSVKEDLLPVNLDDISPPMEISAGLTSDALLHRPDIMAAEHQLKATYAFIGAARSAFFPRISLTSAIGTASDELSGLFKSGRDTWSFTPMISAPIFDARVWAAWRVSKADRQIALTNYENTIQRAFREVADSLAVQGSIVQQISAQQSLLTAVSETYRLSEERYKSGIDSYLGVLYAQNSEFAAQQGLVNLHLAGMTNRVRLYTVLGGGIPTR